MRVHVNSWLFHTFLGLFGYRATVLVDGVEVEDCVEVDVRKRYAVVYVEGQRVTWVGNIEMRLVPL